MKVTAFYQMPLDEEVATRMIEKARGMGYPVLAVVLEVEDKPNRSVGGFALGAKVAELDGDMVGAGGSTHFAESFENLEGA
jgi:hypothetical protein